MESGRGGCEQLDHPFPVLVLLVPEAPVERVPPGQQLVVRAALADGAVLQHQDLVRVGHGRQAVRDADGRAPLRGRLQRLQDGLRTRRRRYTYS